MYRGFFTIILISGLVGGLIGSLTSASLSRANVFDSLRSFFGQDIVPRQESDTPPYRSAIAYEEAVINAVEKASPAVVSIVISKDVPIIEQCPVDPFSGFPGFNDFFGGGIQFYEPCERGTEEREVGGGSGFIVSSDGLIVTNKHVALDESASYTVFRSTGEKYAANIVAQDPILDIALLQIEAEDLPMLTLGNSDAVKLGQTAIAIGNALGEFRNTVSVGVVSGLSRTITAQGDNGFQETIEGVLQTDAAINKGNSGGPLLNLQGEVIGVNTAVASGAQNIGFAIPVNQIKRALTSFEREGEIIIPYLGVRYISITASVAEREGLSMSSGALLRGSESGPAIMPDSPAEKAGLHAEDIILEVNGQRINENRSLSSLIQRYAVGESVSLKVLRNGEEILLDAVLERREF